MQLCRRAFLPSICRNMRHKKTNTMDATFTHDIVISGNLKPYICKNGKVVGKFSLVWLRCDVILVCVGTRFNKSCPCVAAVRNVKFYGVSAFQV